jgi:hypothetical protein
MSGSLLSNIRVTLDPLALVRSALEGRALVKEYGGNSSIDQLEAAFMRLKYVEEAELGHLNYITIDCQTWRFDIAERRVQRVEELVRKAIARWADRLPLEAASA